MPSRRKAIIVWDSSDGEVLEVALVRDDESPNDTYERVCAVEAATTGTSPEDTEDETRYTVHNLTE